VTSPPKSALSARSYAEDYHQQYLAKNPHGYDCHANTGIAYPGLDG
jgi:peptide methionine sulfoxide reductase MsrA